MSLIDVFHMAARAACIYLLKIVSELWPSSGILRTRNWMFSLSGERKEISPLLGPLDRANHNHWTAHVEIEVDFATDGQSASSSWCRAPLWGPYLQQFHKGKADRCPRVSSLLCLLLMTCRTSSTGTVVKRLTALKLTRVSRDWRLTDCNNCTKLPESWRRILVCHVDMDVCCDRWFPKTLWRNGGSHIFI
jgi:hypothetical protein